MAAFSLKKIFGFVVDALLYSKSTDTAEQLPRKPGLAPEKQQKLENLYRQLLSNKELVTSGKIQFIGLEQIKKRMGASWADLNTFVYKITEEIITKHIDKTDLFLGYKDDSYVIIFTQASTEEAKNKITVITDEIRRRLFTLDEEELKKIEIRKSVKKIKTKSFLEKAFPEMMNMSFSEDMLFKQKGDKISALYSDKMNVSAESVKAVSLVNQETISIPANLAFIYIPLWEVKRAALTTYICLPTHAQTEKKSFYAYNELYSNTSKEQQLQLDLKALEHVVDEIGQMEKDGRKLYVACPVRYDTLHNFSSYEIYKKACEKIAESKREYLIFVVIDSGNAVPLKDPYWFISPLKSFCYDIFLEVPLKHDTNFQLLKASGAETIGLHFNHSGISEQESITISNNFSSKAKYFKLQNTFALDVSTLSATTSLVCAGFDYIGGSAIHEDVAKPDTIHRYRYEDLLTDLAKSTT